MLNDGYGVLAGTLASFERDTPDNQGRWFHVKLTVDADGNTFEGAVDVDSKQSNVGVQWKVVALRSYEWTSMASLAPGYHAIRGPSPSHPGTSDDGALDYIRDARFKSNPGCLFVTVPDPLLDAVNRFIKRKVPPWSVGNNEQAAAALEGLLSIGQRIWIYGEPFKTDLGMHNIHQNQGDPIASQWAAENGIWQDGATIVEVQGGGLVAFLNKFSTQSSNTNDHGAPI